jgi:hypothetical protein
MKKRTSMLIAAVAAFLAGRSVHAGNFVDSITGGAQPGPSPSFMAPYNSAPQAQATQTEEQAPAEQGASQQQMQYKKFLADRAARKNSASAGTARQYQEKTPQAETNTQTFVPPAQAQPQAQAQVQELPQPVQEQARNDVGEVIQASAVRNDIPAARLQAPYMAPVVQDDGSALSPVHAPRPGYPYTAD